MRVDILIFENDEIFATKSRFCWRASPQAFGEPRVGWRGGSEIEIIKISFNPKLIARVDSTCVVDAITYLKRRKQWNIRYKIRDFAARAHSWLSARHAWSDV